MSAIFALWIALIVLFLFYKFPIGVYLYIAYIFLVPYLQIQVGVTLSWNLINMLLLLATYRFYKKEHIHVDWTIMKPFFVFFGIQLVMLLFQSYTPKSYMFDMLRGNAMNTLIVPSSLLILCQSSKVNISLIKELVLTCITIASVYGLVLTLSPGLNPYIMIVSELNDVDYLESYFVADDSGRLFGRISSVFSHPMTFACFLGFAFIFVFSLKEDLKKSIFFPLIGLIVINCVTCGVRSVLGGLLVASIYYFYRQMNLKTAALFGFVSLIGYIIITDIPELNNYLGSITQQDSANVGGSSLEMRMEQLSGAWAEFLDSPIWGKGYNWHAYYIAEKGMHPVLLYFESLIYMILCDSGVLGALLWLYTTKRYTKVNTSLLKNSSMINALIIFYIVYACVTGDYGYMRYFLIIYVVMFYSNITTNVKPDSQ